MSTFHEGIRNVLTEVDKFIESLKNEKLSKKVQTGRDKVVEAIKKLRKDFPALESQSELTVPDNDADHVSNESIKTKGSHGSGNAEEEDVVYSENVAEKSVKDLTEPTKAGFLDKRRKKPTLLQSAYQKRYCIVKDRFFYYFEKTTDKKQAGAFSLEGYEFKEAPQYVQGKDVNKKVCFELTSPGKRSFQGRATEEVNDLVFLVDSKEEFQAWQEAITGSSSEDIYEEMEEVAEKAKALGKTEQKTQEMNTDNQEVYDDAAVVEGDLDEIYDDVDNVDRSNVTSLPDPPDLPPPVPPPLKKPVMALPDLPLPDLPLPDLPPPDLPLPDPPTIQNQPLPDLPPPRPQKVPPRPKLEMTENPDEDYENMYYGKWDCSAGGEDELSFKHGDIIHVINKDFDSKNWWVGRLNEKYGLVPKNYLVLAYKASQITSSALNREGRVAVVYENYEDLNKQHEGVEHKYMRHSMDYSADGYLRPVQSPSQSKSEPQYQNDAPSYQNEAPHYQNEAPKTRNSIQVKDEKPSLPQGPPPSQKRNSVQIIEKPSLPQGIPPSQKPKSVQIIEKPSLPQGPPPSQKRNNVQVIEKPSLPQGPPPSKKQETPPKLPPPRREPIRLSWHPEVDYENMYYGKWDHNAEAATEQLAFKYGDIIHIINRDLDNSGWWIGRKGDNYGLVAKLFLAPAYTPFKGK